MWSLTRYCQSSHTAGDMVAPLLQRFPLLASIVVAIVGLVGSPDAPLLKSKIKEGDPCEAAR